MNKRLSTLLMTSILLSLSCASYADSTNTERTQKPHKAKYNNDEGIAGPSSTTGLLEEDDEVKDPVLQFPAIDESLKPWFDFKANIYEETGIQFGFAYTTLYQSISESLTDEDTATSGILRFSGKWELINRGKDNMGYLVFSLDNRSSYSDVPPNALGSEAGYVGQTGTLFGDQDTLLGDLYYVQKFNYGDAAFVIGRYDPNDFFNVLGYANPWTTFQNLSLLNDTTIAIPDWGTGIGLGTWVNDHWYIKGSVSDANGVASESDFNFDTDELYKTAEMGWSPSKDVRYLSNVHVMVWQVDERPDAGIASSDGVVIGANWTWNEEYMLFSKIGLSDSPNAAQFAEKSYTLGGLYRARHQADLLGLAINYSEMNGGGEQTVTELFYRLQLAQNFAITPSIQFIQDPVGNNEDVNVFGLRMRLTL
jgi:porin